MALSALQVQGIVLRRRTAITVLSRTLRCLAGRAAVTVGVAALLAGCTSASPGVEEDRSPEPSATRPAEPPPPPPDAPTVGECRLLTFDDIGSYTDDTKPRPCRRRHTSYAFAIGELPSDVAFDGVEIDNDAVQRAAAAACRSLFADFVGGTPAIRALARLSPTYFVPEQRGFDLGARWVRCDVVGLLDDATLAPLSPELEGLLDDVGALEEYGVCSQGEPGSAEFVLVMCRTRHDYRAIEAIRLDSADASYPGRDVTAQEGRDQCAELVAERLGVGGGYTFGWTYPSAEDWSEGQRFGFCWLQTSD